MARNWLLSIASGLLATTAYCADGGESDPPAEHAVIEDDPNARTQAALAAGDPEDPLLRADLADAYLAAGRDEDALRELLWCIDEFKKHDSPQHSVREAGVLAGSIQLAERYGPAMDALTERRRAAEERIRDGSADSSDALFVVVVNIGLRREAATLELYDSVKHTKLPDIVLAPLRRDVQRILVKNKRYDELVAEFDIAAQASKRLDGHEELARLPVDADVIADQADGWVRESFAKLGARTGEQMMAMVHKGMDDEFRKAIGTSYEVLTGAGQSEPAEKIATRLIELLDDAKTRHALAWAGYRSGSPVEESLLFAREAFEMTGGESLHVVDTLARLLVGFGHRDEAIAVAETGLGKAKTPPERQLMAACLEYCRDRPDG